MNRGGRNSFNHRRNSVVDHIRKSWLIIVFGVILTFAGVFVLLKNEKQAARKIVSLDEAMASVVTVKSEANPQEIKNGQIVHIVGQLYTNEPLTEPDYNIQVQAVKLKRRVQMYQWVEQTTESNYGQSADIIDTETTTYYYVTEWRDHLIDSSLFHNRYGHENPKVFPLENRVQIAPHVNIGNFELGHGVKSEINNFIDITSDTRPEDPSVKLHSGLYYHCSDVFSPEIGDIRLQFTTAGIEGNYYTVVGMLWHGMVVPYETSIETHVLIILPGRHSIGDAFHAAHYERKLQSWGLRFIGWVLLFFAVTCTSELISISLIDLPFASAILPNGQHPLYGNIILSLSMAFVISALCWLVVRPWMGVGMLCAAVSPFLFCARSIARSYQRVGT